MNKKVLRMCRCAVFTGILCILAQITVYLPSIVPITMQTFAVYLIALCLSPLDATISTMLYIVLGAIGLPVFSGFNGGLSSLIGPAGGFIFSFPIMALVISLMVKYKDDIKTNVISLIVGTGVTYFIGSIWFMFITKSSIVVTLTACVLPFIIGDSLKIFISIIIAKRLKTRINFDL
ncbi:MAG: biotin transporter BioY [Thomasclavelia sp.]|nr:biotin transporter BioY [Thomasclavelia sp.]